MVGFEQSLPQSFRRTRIWKTLGGEIVEPLTPATL
jgi:hypothetical protein